MIGEIIQEYLVSLGAKIDRPGFQEMDRTIQAAGQTIEKATGSWAENFVKAGTIIGSAIAAVNASVLGLMHNAAKTDLEMQKYARSMMMSRDAAERMKRATDALGESINDIALTPELLGRFQQLTADGSKMMIGGDFKETMQNFRELTFEFQRLKQEASYAMTWIGYYLMKYLQKPLAEVKARFKEFNDTFVKNISTWTEKAARAIVYIVNVGKHLMDFILDVSKALYNIWDSFPKGVKIATAALLGLWAVIKMSPLGRMITLVSTLLLLIDDYYGYMEGKQAAFGEYWDKLNDYLEKASTLWEELKPKIWDAADAVGNFVEKIKNSSGLQWFLDTSEKIVASMAKFGGGIIDFVTRQIENFGEGLEKSGGDKEFLGLLDRLANGFVWLYESIQKAWETLGKWLTELSKDKDVRDFTKAIGECVGEFIGLFNAIIDLVNIAFSALFDGFEKTDGAYSFRDAIKAVLKVVTMLTEWVTDAVKGLKDLAKTLRDVKPFRDFWEQQGRAAEMFMKVIEKALKSVGKFGQALLALKNGEFSKAWDFAKEGWNELTSGDKKDNRGTERLDQSKINFHDVRTNSGVTAETLDKLFEGGVMEGMGKDFIEIGKKYGIDPAFLAAITKAENSYGHDMSGKLGNDPEYKNNVFSNESGKTFASIRENLEDMAQEISAMDGYYFGQGKYTIDEIGAVYAPPGQNDVNGENWQWPMMVKSAYEDMLEIQQNMKTGLGEMAKLAEFNPGGGGGNWDTGSIFDNKNLDVMSNVSTEGAQEQAIAMLNYAGELYKKLFPDAGELWVSAVTNGNHAEGSGHYRGMKGDVGGDAFEIGGDLGLTEEQALYNRDLFTRELLKVGIGANDEYTYPSSGSTGGHFDLDAEGKVWNDSQYKGEYGGFRGIPQSAFMQTAYAPNNRDRNLQNGFMPIERQEPIYQTPPIVQTENNKMMGMLQNLFGKLESAFKVEQKSVFPDGTPTGQQDFSDGVEKGLLTPIEHPPIENPIREISVTQESYSGVLHEIKAVLSGIFEKLEVQPNSESSLSVDISPFSGILENIQDILKGANSSASLKELAAANAPVYAGSTSNVGSIINTINVGGITVQGGTNANARDIGKEAAAQIMARLEKNAWNLNAYKTGTGSVLPVA